MEGISGGLESVDAAVTPCELSQKMFGRDKGRSHLEVCRQIQRLCVFGMWDSVFTCRLIVGLFNKHIATQDVLSNRTR